MKTSRTIKSLVAGVFAAALLTVSLGRADAFLDKTRFVAHLGVAYFCFHHWVLKPYQDGAFAGGAPHRISTIVKGGAALLFAVHEVKVAEKIAKDSPDPLLQKLDGGLNDLTSSFGAIGEKLKSATSIPPTSACSRAKATRSPPVPPPTAPRSKTSRSRFPLHNG